MQYIKILVFSRGAQDAKNIVFYEIIRVNEPDVSSGCNIHPSIPCTSEFPIYIVPDNLQVRMVFSIVFNYGDRIIRGTVVHTYHLIFFFGNILPVNTVKTTSYKPFDIVEGDDNG